MESSGRLRTARRWGINFFKLLDDDGGASCEIYLSHVVWQKVDKGGF